MHMLAINLTDMGPVGEAEWRQRVHVDKTKHFGKSFVGACSHSYLELSSSCKHVTVSCLMV